MRRAKKASNQHASTHAGREIALLFACLRLDAGEARKAVLRDLLSQPLDWTLFARKVIEHRIGAPVANTLLNTAADLLPDDIHDAFRALAQAKEGATVAPTDLEDRLLSLAVSGADEPHLNLRWSYAVSALVASCGSLNWIGLVERARDQGCKRMLVFAVLLGHECFGIPVPGAVFATRREAAAVRPLIQKVVANWQSENPVEAAGYRLTPEDRVQLQDGLGPRLRRRFVVHRFLPDGKSLRARIVGSSLGLALVPASPENKARIRRSLAARKAAEAALSRNAKDAAAWRNLGHAFFRLDRYRDAISAYDKALTFEPEHPVVWKNRSVALREIGAEEPDLGSPRSAGADAWLLRAGALWRTQRFAEAADACDRVLALDPGNVPAARLGIHCRLHSCDWSRREADKRRVTEGLNAGAFIIRTMDHRALSDSEEENRLAARLIATELRDAGAPLWAGERYAHDRIRIAYLSTDFRVHAVASLIVGCFENHDRKRFETFAVSLQPGDGSELRRRMEAAFDGFIHAEQISDTAVAQLLRKLEIDIAVDLNGYTGHIRTRILARRPAPIQVSYLGFAGTMDAPFIDYAIADPVVLPEENRRYYSEKIAYLPYCYMPADNRRQIAAKPPTREEAGLPETGFVFACLSYAHKISPEIFSVWMRLLRSLDGSVLWLRSANTEAVGNLRRKAKLLGVDPDRLIFAAPVPHESEYLARMRLAGLFLDTLTYNAHATACDALWAGLPLVTCAGKSFHSRVAASLLYAAGLQELVTFSLEEYEAVARALAADASRLAQVKSKLLRNRDTVPLFDTPRVTRDLESAYTVMWRRHQAGEPPAHFVLE